jgi:hypothetical protein
LGCHIVYGLVWDAVFGGDVSWFAICVVGNVSSVVVGGWVVSIDGTVGREVEDLNHPLHLFSCCCVMSTGEQRRVGLLGSDFLRERGVSGGLRSRVGVVFRVEVGVWVTLHMVVKCICL